MLISTLDDPDNAGCRALVAWATGVLLQFQLTRQIGEVRTLEMFSWSSLHVDYVCVTFYNR